MKKILTILAIALTLLFTSTSCSTDEKESKFEYYEYVRWDEKDIDGIAYWSSNSDYFDVKIKNGTQDTIIVWNLNLNPYIRETYKLIKGNSVYYFYNTGYLEGENRGHLFIKEGKKYYYCKSYYIKVDKSDDNSNIIKQSFEDYITSSEYQKLEIIENK